MTATSKSLSGARSVSRICGMWPDSAKWRKSRRACTPRLEVPVISRSLAPKEANTCMRFFERVKSTLRRRQPSAPLMGPKRCGTVPPISIGP
ncbi:hypothetical protein D3C78_1231110 [compost metagenome]